jgi:hypothetical protein
MGLTTQSWMSTLKLESRLKQELELEVSPQKTLLLSSTAIALHSEPDHDLRLLYISNR